MFTTALKGPAGPLYPEVILSNTSPYCFPVYGMRFGWEVSSGMWNFLATASIIQGGGQSEVDLEPPEHLHSSIDGKERVQPLGGRARITHQATKRKMEMEHEELWPVCD